jgi:hypothetical protein
MKYYNELKQGTMKKKAIGYFKFWIELFEKNFILQFTIYHGSPQEDGSYICKEWFELNRMILKHVFLST